MRPESQRVSVDVAWARELLGFVEEQLRDTPSPDAVESQVQAVFAASYARDQGILRYAFGAPLDEVRDAFRRSVHYTLSAFQMRGAPAAWESANDDESPDASLTNAKRGLDALELALAGGAIDLAEQLAPLVWDPLDASYLGRGSVVCTPEQQQLAYALRDLLLDRDAKSEPVRALRTTDSFGPSERARAWTIVSLSARDEHAYLLALAALHAVHLDRVRGVGAIGRLDDVIDLPSLAYAALGSTHFAHVTLPQTDAFLPLDLSCAPHAVPHRQRV